MEVGDPDTAKFWEKYQQDVATLRIPIVVRAEFGRLDPMIQWCKSNTEDTWKWKMINMPNQLEKGTYEFWFKSDVDAEMFALRWKS